MSSKISTGRLLERGLRGPLPPIMEDLGAWKRLSTIMRNAPFFDLIRCTSRTWALPSGVDKNLTSRGEKRILTPGLCCW